MDDKSLDHVKYPFYATVHCWRDHFTYVSLYLYNVAVQTKPIYFSKLTAAGGIFKKNRTDIHLYSQHMRQKVTILWILLIFSYSLEL